MREHMRARDEASIYEQYETALFRAAFYEIERKEQEALAPEAMDGANERQMDAFFERTQRNTLKLIDVRLAREQRGRFARHTLPNVARVAAAMLLVFFISATVAVAAVPGVRARFLRLLIDIQSDHTELRLIEDHEGSFDLPEGWYGSYFPSYIPEGYHMTYMDSDDVFCEGELEYANEEGKVISYSEHGEDTQTDINTENALIEYITIHGQPAMRVTRDTGISVVWAEYDRYFIIWGQTDAQTVTAIAERVLRINYVASILLHKDLLYCLYV